MPAEMIRIMVRSMPPVPRHRPACLAVGGVLACALLFSACGSHLVTVDSSEVRLRIDEFNITPQTVQVHAGRIKIAVVNVGVATHDVEVRADHTQKNGDPIPYNVPTVLKPGESTTFKVLLKPGHYKLLDTVANHADLGDYGTLIVVP
jgi:plastocyanin